MGLVPKPNTVGVTVKFLIEGDEELTRQLLATLPGDFTIAGADLAKIRFGVPGREIEPVRVWVQRQLVSIEREDDFLENG